MLATNLTELKQKHGEYIAKAKAKGMKTLTFRTPCCEKDVEDRAAPAGEKWDTLATCPHCGAMYMKISTAEAITAEVVELY
jgi:hypothetical protein